MASDVSISDLVERIKNRDVSVADTVKKALGRVAETEEYNATLETASERLDKRIESLEEKLADGDVSGRLFGVPFIAKDNFLTYDTKTTASSNILKNFTAPYQATAIEKLEKEGALMIAKSNLDAFAHGSSTENSDFGPTKNPHDKTRVPGGSSGGSAAAVALDSAPFALGTDTGGSIRQPASFTGVVGYKPSYGLISRYGVIAMASSTDVIGPLTHDVEDAALLVDIMSGKDKFDSTTIKRDQASYLDLDADLNKIKIGVVKEYMNEGVHKDVREAIDKRLEKLEAAGAMVEEVSLPSVEQALAVYYIVVPAEISSNLARYDGIRYGYSDEDATNLEEVYKLSRARGFGAEAKRRIMIGTYVLSSGYYDAYYKRAQAVRTLLIKDFKDVFEEYDVLVGPTAPTTAFKLGENTDDPLQMYLSDIMTVAASLVGAPAISLPVGKDSGGLPIGMQMIAKQRDDRKLLGVAKRTEELYG